MALVTRLYRSIGMVLPDLARYVGPTAVVVAQTGTFIQIQYDNTIIDADALDGVMAGAGYVFDVAADQGLTIRSPNGTPFTIAANNAGNLLGLSVAPAPDPKDEIPIPEGRVTGSSGRVLQTTFDGASFIVRRPMSFDRILLRITGTTSPGSLRLCLYQAPDGSSGSGPLPRIATITGFVPGSAGNFVIPLDEGTVSLLAGLVYVLYGRDSATGSATLRSYTTQNVDGLSSNVDVNVHPTSFITAIAVPLAPAAAPATFDPRQTPTGQAIASALDVIPVVRFYKT